MIPSNLNTRQNDITSSVFSEQLINKLIHVEKFHFFKNKEYNHICCELVEIISIQWLQVLCTSSRLCSSRKYPYSPHTRDWNFLGVKDLCKTEKNAKKCMKLN